MFNHQARGRDIHSVFDGKRIHHPDRLSSSTVAFKESRFEQSSSATV